MEIELSEDYLFGLEQLVNNQPTPLSLEAFMHLEMQYYKEYNQEKSWAAA